MKIVALHHFAIPLPVGREQAARDFYVGILGLVEEPKPTKLGVDGGCWFLTPDGRQVHLQSDSQFAPLRHPHPALAVEDIDAAAAHVEANGYTPRWDDRWDGVRRFFLHDPFGNRIEILEAKAVGL
ncbi:MAG: VOC family protein [Armatimonadota bacterium]